MAVEVPDAIDADAARTAIAPAAATLGLEVWVGDATGDEHTTEGERCVISVYGADHPGIVHATSSALAELGVNILDLSSRVVGDPPVYVLGIEAELPPSEQSGEPACLVGETGESELLPWTGECGAGAVVASRPPWVLAASRRPTGADGRCVTRSLPCATA